MDEKLEVKDAKIEDYFTFLKEPSRPPSRGGNTKALHQHVIIVDGEKYSFLAFGSKRWAFKSDLVSFQYVLKGQYKNIDKETIRTVNAKGQVVVRGMRDFQKKLRTAPTRLPGSRRERRD